MQCITPVEYWSLFFFVFANLFMSLRGPILIHNTVKMDRYMTLWVIDSCISLDYRLSCVNFFTMYDSLIV